MESDVNVDPSWDPTPLPNSLEEDSSSSDVECKAMNSNDIIISLAVIEAEQDRESDLVTSPTSLPNSRDKESPRSDVLRKAIQSNEFFLSPAVIEAEQDRDSDLVPSPTPLPNSLEKESLGSDVVCKAMQSNEIILSPAVMEAEQDRESDLLPSPTPLPNSLKKESSSSDVVCKAMQSSDIILSPAVTEADQDRESDPFLSPTPLPHSLEKESSSRDVVCKAMHSNDITISLAVFEAEQHRESDLEPFPTSLQNSMRKESSSKEGVCIPIQSNAITSSPAIMNAETGRDSDLVPSVYDRLKLGLLMTLIYKIGKNIKVAAVTTIYIQTFLSGFDTTSDLGMVFFYFSQGLTILAVAVIASDYVSGLIVLFHHVSSEGWKNSSSKDKIFDILILACHPFSLVATNVSWLMKISDPQRHRLARLSCVLHGGIEAPMQFLIFSYAFSHEIIPLPWGQSTSVIDRNGNTLFLGKVSLFSFILTMVSLLKSAMETFELESIPDQMWAAIYAILNLSFRILGIAFIVIYLEIFCLPFFVVLFGIIYVILMYHREQNKEGASTISSMAVATFLPICISRCPEQFQIKDMITEENEIIDNRRKVNMFMMTRKRVSVWISIITNPLILMVDTIVHVLLELNELTHDTIWTNKQCKDFYTYLLCPLFVLCLIASICFYPLQNGKNMSERMRNNFIDKVKKVFSVLCLLGAIVVTINFALVVENLNRFSVVFVNKNNELTLMQVVSKGHLFNCSGNEVSQCMNTKWNNTNFRATDLIEELGYISSDISIAEIENTTSPFYDLNAIHHWAVDAPEELTRSKPHCKKCASKNPRRKIICKQLLEKINQLQNCDGEFR